MTHINKDINGPVGVWLQSEAKGLETGLRFAIVNGLLVVDGYIHQAHESRVFTWLGDISERKETGIVKKEYVFPNPSVADCEILGFIVTYRSANRWEVKTGSGDQRIRIWSYSENGDCCVKAKIIGAWRVGDYSSRQPMPWSVYAQMTLARDSLWIIKKPKTL